MRPVAGWLLPLMGAAIVGAMSRLHNQTEPQQLTEGVGSNFSRVTMSRGIEFPYCPHCNEQVVPDTKWCPACGKTFGAEVLAQWKAKEPPHFGSTRWALVSMGLDPVGRVVGTVVACGLLVFVAYAWLVYAMSNETPEPASSWVVTGMALFCAYDIWAFTHGKSTHLNNLWHPATLSNTGWRTASLAIDGFVLVTCVTLFLRGL